MREEKEREDTLNFPEMASCFSPLPFPIVRNSRVCKRGIILQTFCRVLDLCLALSCSVVTPQMGEKMVFLWCSWYGYTLLLHVPVLLFDYFSPLLTEIISAPCFTNPHASRYAFSYLAVRGLFSFYLVPDLFFGSCVVRIQTSCFTCLLDSFAVYINKTYLAAGAVLCSTGQLFLPFSPQRQIYCI